MSSQSQSESSSQSQQPPRLYGCSPISSYKLTTKLGEGTFGQVHRGTFVATSTAVALKEIIVHERTDGMPITALREIKIMKALRHPNILHLLDMAVSKSSDRDSGSDRRSLSTYYMVMSYMDHDLCGLLHNRDIRFTLPHIKLYMSQLLAGVAYLHEQQYMHRDMKSANVLVSNDGNVKVADFGLARKYFEAPPDLISATPASHKYTPKVVTRWYRPPELLLGEQYYTTAIDIWGVGCIFGEFFKRQVIIPGNSDADQVHQIFKLVGSPTDETLPNFAQLPLSRDFMPLPEQPNAIDTVFDNVPPEARDLLKGLLNLNPLKRLTAKGALDHKFFTEGVPAAKYGDLPVYPSSRELDVRRKREAPPSPANNLFSRGPKPKRARVRAFQPRIRDKRILTPQEQIPPYKRGNPDTHEPSSLGSGSGPVQQRQQQQQQQYRQPRQLAGHQNVGSENGAAIMNNGLDY